MLPHPKSTPTKLDNDGPTVLVCRRLTHYLICDRDRIYGCVVTRRLRAMGIRDKPAAPEEVCSILKDDIIGRFVRSTNQSKGTSP